MNKQWTKPIIKGIDISQTSGGGNWGGSEMTLLESIAGTPLEWYGASSFDEYWFKTLSNYNGDLTLEQAKNLYTPIS